MDPITNVCIVDKKSNCPPQYHLVDRTREGEDADLWKDGMFRSKVTRYICFTKTITENQWNHVATNMRLIGMKDPVPQGYTAIRQTVDTKESALRKHILCVQFLPKTATTSGISDFIIARTTSYKSDQYTFVGELNNLHLCFKLSPLPRVMASRPPPPLPTERQFATPVCAPPPRPEKPGLRPSNSLSNGPSPLSGIDGVPFKLHDRFLNSGSSENVQDNLNISIKTKSELDELFSYDFSKERNVIVGQVSVLSM